jgi:hypothetical protein
MCFPSCIYMYVSMHICMYVCICAYVCMYACIYVRKYVCVYAYLVCVCVWGGGMYACVIRINYQFTLHLVERVVLWIWGWLECK